MESGGGLLRRDWLLNTIDKADASIDQGEQLRGIQAPEVSLGHLEPLLDRNRIGQRAARVRRRERAGETGEDGRGSDAGGAGVLAAL
jgi:hypothetical protein